MIKLLVTCLLAMLLTGCSDLENYLERKFGSVVFFTISATVSLWCFRSARKSNKMFEMMESIPISSISYIHEGPTEIRGKVKVQEDVLVSPWGKKRCVYYKFEVDQEESENRSSEYVREEQSLPFIVQDDSGQVNVDDQGAVFELKLDKNNSSGMFKSPPPKLVELLKTRYGKKVKGLIFNKSLTFRETAIELNDEVYVFGTAIREETSHNETYCLKKGKMPLIITDKGGAHVELGFKKDGMTMKVIGGVALCFTFLGYVLLVT